MSDRRRILAVCVALLAAVVFASGAHAVADRTSGRIPTTGLAQDTAPAIASAYNALPPSLAGRDVRLPLWRNGHTKSGLTTGIAVTNVSDAQADVTITFAASGNDVATFTAVLAPRATHYWWPPDHPELALGFRSAYGSAHVVSTEPVVAVVADLSIPTSGDPTDRIDAAAYVGMARDASASGTGDPTEPGPVVAMVPLVAREAAAPLTEARSGVAGIHGAGTSGILVQNLDSAYAAVIVAEFYPQSWGEPKSFPAMADAGGTASFYLPALSDLQDGAYSAFISSDRAIGVLARTDWPTSAGAAAYENALPGTDVIVPVVFRNHRGRCSLVTIHNSDTSASRTATVELYQQGTGALLFSQDFMIARGSSITLQPCMDDSFDMALPSVFVGTMRVKAAPGAPAFAAHSFVDYSGEGSERAVNAFEGAPVTRAETVLFAPLVHALWSVPEAAPLWVLRSRVAVANPGDEPVRVRVVYNGARGTCAGQEFSQGPVTVSANDLILLDPSDDGVLPAGCLAGARIEATGKVVASVLDEGDALEEPTATPVPTPTATAVPVPAIASAYTALPRALAGRDVRLFLWRNGDTDAGRTTGIAVTNIGTTPADVTIAFKTGAGALTGSNMTVPAGGTHYWWPPDVPGLPAGESGTARITSSQPVVAAVTELSLPTSDDWTTAFDASSFVGVAADGARPGPVSIVVSIPDARNGDSHGLFDSLASDLAGISGGGATDIAVHNFDPAVTAQVSIDLYPQSDAEPISLPATIGPGDTTTLRLQDFTNLPNGAYSAVINADRPIAAHSRTEWAASRASETTGTCIAGAKVVVPVAMKRSEGRCSVFTIQNMDSGATRWALVEIYPQSGAAVLFAHDFPIRAGRSITFDLCDDELTRNQLPDGFVGTMRLTSRDGSAPFAVESIIDYRAHASAKAVSACEGVPVGLPDMADTVLFAPLVHAQWNVPATDPHWQLSTRLAIANPGATAAVVNVTYTGIGGTCAGRQIAHDPVTVAPNGAAILDPSADLLLPAGCLAAAKIEANGKVVASVLDEGALIARPEATPVPTDTEVPTPTGVVTESPTPAVGPTDVPTAVPPSREIHLPYVLRSAAVRD